MANRVDHYPDDNLVDDDSAFIQQFRGGSLSLSFDENAIANNDNERRAGSQRFQPEMTNETDLEFEMRRNGGNLLADCNNGQQQEMNEFFAMRLGAFEKAAESCKPVLLRDVDRELKGVWLLTEIDHWDAEKERLIYLTNCALIIMKYDFISLRLLEYKRHELAKFDKIVFGDLKYPEGSLIPPRTQKGVRCMWNREQVVPMAVKWNPFSKTVPWLTLTSHPLVSAFRDHPYRGNYDVEDFFQFLLQTMRTATAANSALNCQIERQPVVIENYAGIAAAVHNVMNLGFFKTRGVVSF